MYTGRREAGVKGLVENKTIPVAAGVLRLCSLATLAVGLAPSAEVPAAFRFDFGSGAAAEGYIQVTPETVYSDDRGYGFEFGAAVTAVNRGGDPLRGDFCTSAEPFFFSVNVPEGNYRVTLTLGDGSGPSIATVKAESRRLMLEKVETDAGSFATPAIIVNVRNSKVLPPPENAPGGDHVELNDREQGVLHWDDKLTLEFGNAAPKIAAVEIAKVDDLPTIFLAGDSTVTDQTRPPTTSWGQMLTRFFKPEIAVANHAESGETLKSFVTSLRLDKILGDVKAGDYLFLQFGHNDMKENWPQTYVEPFTTYKAYLKTFIAEARRRGVTPVLITSMHRRNFDSNGKIRNTLGDFPEAVRQAAREEDVALIDLHAMSAAFYEALGPEKSPLAFGAGGRDATHHSSYGAYELARCVVEGIKAAKLDLAKHLVSDVPAFDPAHPDMPEAFRVPASPRLELGSSRPTLYVAGDSTAQNGEALGWGDPFAALFDPARIVVANRARGGRSSRTFQTEGLWEEILSDLKRGDYVLIQFGHNDGGSLDTGRARGSLPGLGEETREVTMPNGNRELVHTFGWYMHKYIADTRAKGATPILLSLTVRNIWNDGKVERGSGNFSQWASEIARSEGVSFVDVTNIIADQYEDMGEGKVKEFFPIDHTHTSEEGAQFNAASVVAGLKALPGEPFAAYFSAQGTQVPGRPDVTAATAPPAPPRAGIFLPSPNLNLPEPKDNNLPTLFLIGDSTVRNGRGDGSNGQWGWGEPLVSFFDPARINVVNRAVGGLSSRTYLTYGHWELVLGMMKPGDFVLMQFGHNDAVAVNDDFRARGTIRGIGEESEEIQNQLTGQHEVVRSYGWYLRKFIAETRAKGAIPMVCSLVPRKSWRDGRIARNKNDYAGWAEQVARAEGAAFLDLNEIIARRYDALGPEKVDPLFGDERTHTSLAGAELSAESVISALEGLQKNPLAPYFGEKAQSVGAFKP